MSISIIVAASENNVIGKNNQLLWHLPDDLKFFKNTTWGMPVVMGRKTFESVNKPLPGRYNIVITRQAEWKADGVMVAADLDGALKKAAETNCRELFIIGGGDVYRQAMEITDKIYMTRIHANFEGDTFFPEINPNDWELVSDIDISASGKNAFGYSFQTWERKR